MFEFISRMQLERRGLSSGKRRRKVAENPWLDALISGAWVRTSIFVGFAILMTLFVYFWRDENALFTSSSAQMILVLNLIIATLIIQFQVNHADSFSQNGRVLLALGVMLSHLILLKIALGFGEYFLHAQEAAHELAMRNQAAPPPSEGAAESILAAEPAPEVASYVFLLPLYGFAPMLMSILLGRNHGTFTAIYVSLLAGLLVPAEMAFELAVLSLVSGFVAVYLTHQVRRRTKVVRAGAFVGIATTILAIAMGLIPIVFEQWSTLLLQCLATLLAGVITAMLVSGVLPLLESLFRITTDVSWIEMADLNHPLLKRLTYEAPGTYHHSLVVARLSEAAADTVGANGTLCRVTSYFHDIGKLTKPQYFIENIDTDENPHDELTPTMSSLIIIAHVKDGIDLALKHNLNNEIIDVIREHHGTSLVQYFHHRALERRAEMEKLVDEGKANPDDLPVVEEKSFRYPGPKPQTRESAIISLADGIESASRTLQKPTPTKIMQMIDEITKSRMRDGQLDECALTLAELATIKKSFHNTLSSMMHNRISYPKSPDSEEKNEAHAHDLIRSEEERAAQAARTKAKARAKTKSAKPKPRTSAA